MRTTMRDKRRATPRKPNDPRTSTEHDFEDAAKDIREEASKRAIRAAPFASRHGYLLGHTCNGPDGRDRPAFRNCCGLMAVAFIGPAHRGTLKV